tara:strand:+ start:576 stop:806 length:231 start_codon:yes stop_codon:yes gene_type:complete
MVKPSFFSTEPFFLKIIYLLSFIGTLYVFYEILFVDEKQHSGIAIYLVALFGFFFLRIALKKNAIKRSSENSNTKK